MSEYSALVHKLAISPHSLTDGDIAVLRRACREHPADAMAPALLLQYAVDMADSEASVAKARVALFAGAPAVIIKAIDPSGKGFGSFYPPCPAENRPTTASAIDIFLETYGHQSAEEDALLEKMIFNPVPDYAEQLAREQPDVAIAEPGSQDELIDAFLSTHLPEKEGASVAVADTPSDDETKTPTDNLPEEDYKSSGKGDETPLTSLLSQSLAKIFIKQGRYERAYEIISNLSLNYPEKSVYFADQMRFLEKLLINQRHSTAK